MLRTNRMAGIRLRHQDIQQELEGINNQPPSEIIQFWKTDFTHYVIPI
jgi:hypothetical protein